MSCHCCTVDSGIQFGRIRGRGKQAVILGAEYPSTKQVISNLLSDSRIV